MKHHCKYVSKRLALLLMVLFVGTFTLTGCGSGGGSDSYSTPGTGNTAPLEGQSSNVLITADTLKAWIDQGKVNSTSSYENVVILQQKGYAAGHIPGAQEWAVSGISRVEGPILSGNMVPDGETMDAMLQERGITANSTVVFMGNNSERIYFFFRYWGFPKSQLKILNGGTAAWTAAGNSLTTVNPVIAASTFSVKDLVNGPNLNVRASLNEMIIGLDEETLVPFAAYGATSVTDAATIKETVTGGAGGYVAFQGRMFDMVQDEVLYASGAANITTELYNADGTYKSKAEMEAYLTSLGADGSKTIATYCRAGNLAANGFTPMDAVLDWDIMLYDGSWSQWGSLTARTDVVPSPTYALPAGYEEWATDELMSEISFNYDYTDDIYQPEFYAAPMSPYDAGANTLEDEDYEYWAAPAAGAGGASGPVSGGGGGC